MTISIFDIYSIGIGPSSSHTVGPMRAAFRFVHHLAKHQLLQQTDKITLDLYGSLALTGKGHHTDKALLMGLEGELPEKINPELINERIQQISDTKKINLLQKHTINFDIKSDLIWNKKISLLHHSNGMRFTASNQQNQILYSQVYYSIGGGTIVREEEFNHQVPPAKAPYPFDSAKKLKELCHTHQCTIAKLMLANESISHTEKWIHHSLLNIAKIMGESIINGCTAHNVLPGTLKLKRRAPKLFQQLSFQNIEYPKHKPILNWVNTYALAVAEENAAGHRIITAPTNGSAGVIPATLQYFKDFCQSDFNPDNIVNFLLVAGAIILLYKKNASISGAEVGCQGEIGVACSAAAGALTAVLGGNTDQILKAATIAMEHNLGLTCDPVAGLVQIPCIERNAMAAVKAINAAHLAIFEREHAPRVSLDDIIHTMLTTGKDMNKKYKETSRAGLARAIQCATCE